MRNHGHQLALSAGLTLCRGERILFIDADLQDQPGLLPDMQLEDKNNKLRGVVADLSLDKEMLQDVIR